MTDVTETEITAEKKEGDEVVRTIFISGLPSDVKQREIRNLLRFVKGFETAVVNTRGVHPLAFATFSDQEAALDAIKLLQGMKFDEENSPQTELRLELAKSNSSGKKRTRDSSSSSMSLGGYSTDSSDKKLRIEPLSMSTSGKAPCNTLFLANLGRYTTEQEIRSVFGLLPGFRKMKFNAVPNKTPVCFVDFVDLTTAQAAMTTYQGHMLPSSEGSGLRIEYAKKPMLPSEGGTAAPAAAVSSYPGYADPYGVTTGYSMDPSQMYHQHPQYAHAPPPGTYPYPSTL